MGYTLAAWHEDHPITNDDAVARYLAAEGAATETPPQLVVDVLEAVLNAWPALEDLSEADADASPWSCTPECDGDMLQLPMTYPGATRSGDALTRLVLESGLVVFDPQRNMVLWPAHLEGLPHCRVIDEAGTIVDQPSTEVLEAMIRGLNTGNSFLIVSRQSNHYMQTQVDDRGRFAVEFRDGSPDDHYRIDNVDVRNVRRLMSSYISENEAWRTTEAWEQIRFD